METTRQIKQKIKGLFKPFIKKDVVVLDKEQYNELIKRIEFLKGLENTSSSFFNNGLKGGINL